MECKCEDHYYEVTVSASNKRILASLINSTVEDVIEKIPKLLINRLEKRIRDGNLVWSDVHGGEYGYENIVERCDHGDVQDCEDCDFKEGE